MGCKRVVALINRRAYAELVQGGPIDIAISPAQVSIGTCWRTSATAMCPGAQPAPWCCRSARDRSSHGDEKSSRVVGRRIGDLPSIPGAILAAIVRDFDKHEDVLYDGEHLKRRRGHVVIAHKDVVVRPGDHVIIFCLNKKVVKKVEKLFAVGFHFF
jgi:trk system potassium uptake protein TrkA